MIPPEAIALAKRFEGFRARAYVCPAGYWTIGYGHLCPSTHPPVSEPEAEAYLIKDMADAAAGAYRFCPGLVLESSGRRAAIIDFVFNLGAGRLKISTLRKKVNAGDWPGAAAELRKWVRGGGRVLPGLVLRREAEIALI